MERTLLIPLLARVWAHRCQLDWSQPDVSAEQVLTQLQGAVPAWMPDPVTLCCILWRTHQMVSEAQTHFERYPRSWGVNLGAGLSDYFQWLDNGVNHWVDTDLERVMQLRLQCLSPQVRHSSVPLDVCGPTWWTRLKACIKSRREPLFIMLEGVLLYLQPNQACQVLATVGENAPDGSTLAFDVIPAWMTGWPVRMPTLGGPQPVFLWGVESMQSLESIHPRLHLESVSSVTTTGWELGLRGMGGTHAAHAMPNCSPYAVVRMSVST